MIIEGQYIEDIDFRLIIDCLNEEDQEEYYTLIKRGVKSGNRERNRNHNYSL